MIRELADELRRHPAMAALIEQMLESTKSDRLRSAGVAIFFVDGNRSWGGSRYLLGLVQSDDPVVAYRAMLWLSQKGLLNRQPFQKEVVGRLTKPGIVNLTKQEHHWVLQRMLFLEKFPDAAIKEAVQEIARNLRPQGTFPIRPQSAVMHPNYDLLGSYPLIPMLRMISRFPDIAAQHIDELQQQYEYSEKQRLFRGDVGDELKQSLEKALQAAGKGN